MQEGVTFAGAYDLLPDKAQQFAATYGGQAHSDMAEMLDQVKPDAVWICLPPFAHGAAEKAVLERRIPFPGRKADEQLDRHGARDTRDRRAYRRDDCRGLYEPLPPGHHPRQIAVGRRISPC